MRVAGRWVISGRECPKKPHAEQRFEKRPGEDPCSFTSSCWTRPQKWRVANVGGWIKLSCRGECAEAQYQRWSAAVEDHLAKPSGTEFVNLSTGRGTVLRTKTVPGGPRVAKDESHAAGTEASAWAGLANKSTRSSSCGNQACIASTAKHE